MNLPNKLSLLRIILVPLMMFFYLATFIPCGKLIAVLLFIVAAITDKLDGKIARRDGLVTDLGKLLDPIADKLLNTCALFLVVFDFDGSGAIVHPVGIITLFVMFAGDTLKNGIRQMAAQKGVAFAAMKSGKLKSVLYYIFIPIFMFLAQVHIWQTQFLAGIKAIEIIVLIITIIAYIILALATIVAIYSAFDYCRKAVPMFKPKTASNPPRASEPKEDEMKEELSAENEKPNEN